MSLKKIWEKLNKRANTFHKPDPKPVIVPVVRQLSLHDRVKLMMEQEEFRRHVQQQGFETLEEAEDFEVGEDYEPVSDHELVFDEGMGKMMYRHEKAILDAARAEGAEAYRKARKKVKPFTEETPVDQKKSKKADQE